MRPQLGSTKTPSPTPSEHLLAAAATSQHNKPMSWRTLVLVCCAAWLAAACEDSARPIDNGEMCEVLGKATKGPADKHCGSEAVTVDMAACEPMSMADEDAGTSEEPAGSDFGETMYGMEGDDDDCKYHIEWSATSLCQNADVYFTLKLTTKSDGMPVAGAMPEPDITLGDSASAQTANAEAEEISDGTYRLGPIRFTQSGNWTVRFHFFDTCVDSETSPRGHAAFFVTIP